MITSDKGLTLLNDEANHSNFLPLLIKGGKMAFSVGKKIKERMNKNKQPSASPPPAPVAKKDNKTTYIIIVVVVVVVILAVVLINKNK